MRGKPAAAAALLTVGLVVVPLASACSGDGESSVAQRPSSTRTASLPAADVTTGSTSPTPTPETPGPLRVATAVDAVDHLARSIGPRHATSPAFDRAAHWLTRQLRAAGYVVHRQRFPVPSGNSWGVPVSAGRSANIVAMSPGS